MELLHSTLFFLKAFSRFFLQLTLNLQIRTLSMSIEELLLNAISNISYITTPLILTIQSMKMY